MPINSVLAVFIVLLVALPVVIYRKTHDSKKVIFTILGLIGAWAILGQVAHLFME